MILFKSVRPAPGSITHDKKFAFFPVWTETSDSKGNIEANIIWLSFYYTKTQHFTGGNKFSMKSRTPFQEPLKVIK